MIQPGIVRQRVRQEHSGPRCPHETNKKPDIMHELTDVIRKWGVIMKELYVVRSNYTYINIVSVTNTYFFQSHHSIETVEKYINKLLKLRREMLYENLLKNQLKEKQRLVALTIDVGNK